MIDLDRIVPLDPDGTAPPLFCVHSSSGSPYSYLKLARFLDNRPVFGIEAPGLDGDREPARSLTALSAEYAQTLRAFRPDADYLLLGWSLGGIIALDMARRLTEDGARVPLVIMVDVSVPHIADLPSEKEIVCRYLNEILAMSGSPVTPAEVLSGAPEKLSSAALFEVAERSGALPSELDADLLAVPYAVFRGLVEASYGFEVTDPYDGPVLHLIASESIASDSQSEHMRWSTVATNLTEHTVDGNHHSIWSPSALPHLAGLVADALSAAGRTSRGSLIRTVGHGQIDRPIIVPVG